jgi:hypothetical protein
MAKYQKRRVLLRKGEQSRELSLEHGHVFDTNERGSYIGYPLYDEKNELAKFDELLTRHQNDGFRIVEDTGLSAAKIHAPKKPDGMDNRTWKWVQEADEILHQWATMTTTKTRFSTVGTCSVKFPAAWKRGLKSSKKC